MLTVATFENVHWRLRLGEDLIAGLFKGKGWRSGSPEPPRMKNGLAALTFSLASILIATSILVMAGWVFHIQPIITPVMGLVTVKFNTALAFLFTGLAFLLFFIGKSKAACCAAFWVAVIGAAINFEHIYGVDLGIDQLLALDPTNVTSAGGRMSPITSTAFLIIGLALLFNKKNLFRTAVTDLAGFVVSVIGLLSLVGYAYRVPFLYYPHLILGLKGFSGMAFVTSCLFLVTGTLFLCFRPSNWLASVVTVRSSGREMVRTFLPVFIALPLILGLVKNYLVSHSILSEEVAIAIIVITMIVVASTAVIALAQRFDKVDQERKVSVEEREDLLYALAHDMKLPLIGSERLLGLIVDGKIKSEADQKQYLQLVRQSNDSLLFMIQNLIYEHRREQSHDAIVKQDIELHPLVKNCVDQVMPLAQTKGLQVCSDVEPGLVSLHADSEAIKRVVVNLLHNAVKFTSSGSVKVTGRRTEKSILLSVSDTGIGISSADQEKLFDKFWQSEAGKSANNGSGLGLHLCRKIISAHGGTISCNSVVGEGSEFTLELPLVA